MPESRSRHIHLHPYRGFFSASVDPGERRVFGKPLRWTIGWTVVAAVLVVGGALLFTVRLQMGTLAVWTDRETRAVHQVKAYRVTDNRTLDEIVTSLPAPGGRWYAFERLWERRVYVVWQRGNLVLTFTVHNGKVAPDAVTRELLRGETQAAVAP